MDSLIGLLVSFLLDDVKLYQSNEINEMSLELEGFVRKIRSNVDKLNLVQVNFIFCFYSFINFKAINLLTIYKIHDNLKEYNASHVKIRFKTSFSLNLSNIIEIKILFSIFVDLFISNKLRYRKKN
jgi:hypothetical protein